MLGDELKRRREEMGLSLAQISEATRIGTRFLRAIETDDFSVLPEGIYTRSFIRAYAKHVHMSEDQAMLLYQEQTGAFELSPDPVSPPVDEKPFVYKEPVSSFWPAAAMALALALVLGTGGWALVHYVGKSSEPAAETAASTVTPAEAPPPSVEPAVRPVADDGTIKVTLQASDECWIGYTADGKRTSKMLEGGQVEHIEASQSVDLSIGNTKVVSIQINGRDAHLPADTPIVLKKLTITPETAQSLVN
jgi:cytoskeletal protein RodZ